MNKNLNRLDKNYISFYEEEYLEKNPSHHMEDSPAKFNQLMSVFSIDENYDKILDAGCGLGFILKSMDNVISPTVKIGCDISLNILSKAKKMNPDSIEYVRCDGSTLPFRDSYFDLVIITDLIEHIPDPIKLLTEIRRVAKRLLIIIPIESGLISDIVFRLIKILGFRNSAETVGHIHRFNMRDCESILERCCFRIDRSKIIKANGSQICTTLLGKLQWSISEKITRVSTNLDLMLIGEYELIAFCG